MLSLGLKTERKRTETGFIVFVSACLAGIGNKTKTPEMNTKAAITGDGYKADT
jgi:hypothetical protein